MSDLFTRDEFAEHEGTTFKLFFTEEVGFEVSLIEVSPLRELDRHQMFSLVFLAPPAIPAEGRIYKLAHKSLGEFEIYLSPFWQDENGIKFEAAFNLLKT